MNIAYFVAVVRKNKDYIWCFADAKQPPGIVTAEPTTKSPVTSFGTTRLQPVKPIKFWKSQCAWYLKSICIPCVDIFIRLFRTTSD